MSEQPRYEYKKYAMARVFIGSGWYTKAEIEAVLKHFEEQDKLLEASIKETK